jgi:hypothetical protein
MTQMRVAEDRERKNNLPVPVVDPQDPRCESSRPPPALLIIAGPLALPYAWAGRHRARLQQPDDPRLGRPRRVISATARPPSTAVQRDQRNIIAKAVLGF